MLTDNLKIGQEIIRKRTDIDREKRLKEKPKSFELVDTNFERWVLDDKGERLKRVCGCQKNKYPKANIPKHRPVTIEAYLCENGAGAMTGRLGTGYCKVHPVGDNYNKNATKKWVEEKAYEDSFMAISEREKKRFGNKDVFESLVEEFTEFALFGQAMILEEIKVMAKNKDRGGLYTSADPGKYLMLMGAMRSWLESIHKFKFNETYSVKTIEQFFTMFTSQLIRHGVEEAKINLVRGELKFKNGSNGDMRKLNVEEATFQDITPFGKSKQGKE